MTAQLTFTMTNVNQAPEQHGVYALYDYTGVIYYGRAFGVGVTIRSRLNDHISGRDGFCTKSATGFAWELTSNPVARERQLLQEFMTLYGRLPKCNNKMP